MNFKHFASILALLVVLLFQSVLSISLESAKERACFKPSKTASIDTEWMGSIKKWYYPLQSKFDLYLITADLVKKDLKKLTEDQLYYESCITWKITSENAVTMNGYGGNEVTYTMKAEEDFSKVKFKKEDGTNPGVGYTTLTDNKSFTVSVTCFEEHNQMVWSVASPYKSLPKETVRKIHEHIKSLGFKGEFFTSQRYEVCEKNRKDEL